MREIKNLEQDTPEWHKFRENKIGASMAPSIMGVGYMTAHQLWQEMMGLSPKQKATDRMKRGKNLEPMIRERVCLDLNLEYKPKVILHDNLDWHFSSLDGLTDDYRHSIEIKVANREDHELAKQGIVPKKHIAQLNHQMIDCELDHTILCSYYDYDGKGHGEIAYVRYDKNEQYCEKLLKAENEFYRCMIEFREPILSDDDHKPITDENWKSTLELYDDAVKQLNYWTEQKEYLKDVVIKMAENRNSCGFGYKLTKSVRIGSVNYSAIPELKDVDLDQYRKEAIESWRITYKEEENG